MVSLPIDELQVGAICRFPLEDDNGLLLLGAGTKITAELIQGLKDREIGELAVRADDVEALSRHDSGAEARRKSHVRPKKSTASAFQAEHPSKWPKGVPLKDNLVDRHHEPYNQSRREVLRGHMKLARDQFEQIGLELMDRKLQTVEALSNLSGAFATAMIDDHDQTVADVVAAETAISLTDRSVKLGVLGMAVGTELGLDGPSILEIGTTGLLHDIGLFVMDPELTMPGRGPLDDDEIWEYRKHSTVSVTCLQEASSIPHGVLTAIEQVHEQYNGSGYPFGIEGKRISTYARILNVCDTYLRLTLGTSFRKALVPHDALGLILHQARHRMFDPDVVKAFLRVESLFPLGSQVRVGDLIASVIRRPINGYAYPVLQTADGQRIDLQNQTEAMIQPIVDPSFNQIRMSQHAMETLRWSPADELLLD
ncbi:HD-GYP domain-containing protein [Neorhodopirellula pilleata]|nr:HD domain-containing phosphohydrolase [Neorhodopirellula pilleata]